MATTRRSQPGDRAAILALHAEAFGADGGPQIVGLVEAMLVDPSAQPCLSLVAELDGAIVGHVMFTPVAIGSLNARVLAPLAVAPAHQRRGVGSSLVRQGLRRLIDDGLDAAFVLGDPQYYARFGCDVAADRGLRAPHDLPDEWRDAWRVWELRDGALDGVSGAVRVADSITDPKYWVA